MEKELKVALIQANLVWENPQKNREQFTEKIEQISGSINLIILPEMFTSGFTMNAEKVAETMDGGNYYMAKRYGC
ncbi:aliphatic amidase AmiE [Algibacter lectus]|uniref:Aliphatic amidase AmiE n=1 Tax=Algibacter lectus TaxID=221126 RepID=A0A090WTT6_9FLAO|nr:aliphatic amidase AmiE [Algibacter lectus]